jgi:hypothetical protein
MPVFLRSAIEELLDDLPTTLVRIECAFAEKRFEELRWQAHKLHGMTLLCGTPILQRAVRALECACVERPNEAEDRLKEFREAVSVLNRFVDEHGIPDAES